MTPAARCAAGIEILDQILDGNPTEKTLTNWARRNRYAGSGDRAAIRDLVFDIIRKCRSCQAAAGGVKSGRALVLGHIRLSEGDPTLVFTGEGYGPAKLTIEETEQVWQPDAWPDAVQLDYPDWLEVALQASLGKGFATVMARMRDRAAVFLRVNSTKGNLDQAVESLARDQIIANPHSLAPYALEVSQNPRRIAASHAYQSGLVELQDAASQAVVSALDLPKTGRILDYCAGGGGKTLAIAASSNAALFAYDAASARMRDLPKRAKRAGAKVTILDQAGVEKQAPFDLVLCDAPCSGSGAWRRSPSAKWELNRQDLDDLLGLQREILSKAALLVRPGGLFAYATCSLLNCENSEQVDWFLCEHKSFRLEKQQVFDPLMGADGLFIATLRRD